MFLPCSLCESCMFVCEKICIWMKKNGNMWWFINNKRSSKLTPNQIFIEMTSWMSTIKFRRSEYLKQVYDILLFEVKQFRGTTISIKLLNFLQLVLSWWPTNGRPIVVCWLDIELSSLVAECFVYRWSFLRSRVIHF